MKSIKLTKLRYNQKENQRDIKFFGLWKKYFWLQGAGTGKTDGKEEGFLKLWQSHTIFLPLFHSFAVWTFAPLFEDSKAVFLVE
jgi:hypothetical protein